jgi:hypothetical protein
MKYYAWAGWENKELHFIIAPIIKIHGKSDFRPGWLKVDADRENSIDNYDRKGGRGIEANIDSLNLYDNIQDARREVIRGLYARV